MQVPFTIILWIKAYSSGVLHILLVFGPPVIWIGSINYLVKILKIQILYNYIDKCIDTKITYVLLRTLGPCTPQNWILDIAKKQGVLLIWNLDIGYNPLKMTSLKYWVHWNLDIVTLFHHSYPFFPPLARQVEDTNFLKSGYRDIGPPRCRALTLW